MLSPRESIVFGPTTVIKKNSSYTFVFFVFLHFPIIIGLIHHFMLLQSTSLLVITAIGLQLCLAPCIYSGVLLWRLQLRK